MSTQVSQPKAFMTAKELFEMPDDDYRYELVKGELIKTKLSILILALIVLAVYFLPGQTFAQTHPVDGTYLTDWLIIGPFFPNDLKTDFLASVGGEANINPKEGDKVSTKDGKALTWRRHKSKSDIIDLIAAVGDYQNATAYTFCILQSQVSEPVEVFLGSDDGAAVWINGKQAHINDIDRPLTQDKGGMSIGRSAK